MKFPGHANERMEYGTTMLVVKCYTYSVFCEYRNNWLHHVERRTRDDEFVFFHKTTGKTLEKMR